MATERPSPGGDRAPGAPRAPRRRWLDLLFALHCAITLIALVWPAYAWAGGRIEPRIAGLPFSMGWVVLWILLTFAALVLYELLGERMGERMGERARERR
jgi:TRAP-type C4-dicarboxylate transport system permease small subunit